MIRFLLPVLLLAFGACQVPNQGNDAAASQASLEVSEDCSGGDCSTKATAASSECSEAKSECAEGQSDCGEGAEAVTTAISVSIDGDGGCCAEKAAAAATAASSESCAMKAAGVCEDGGECPMEAAGNTECSEMGTMECPMEKAKAEAAVQASLVIGEGCCEGQTVAEACGGCAEKATAAAMSQCESMKSDCGMEAAATAAGSESCAMKAAATAAGSESCAMKAAGVCEDGGECPMKAAGNTECSEMGTKECPMEKAKAEAAVQASLVIGEGCCEGKTVAEACGGCAEKATAASMKQCESMKSDCELKAAAKAGLEKCETKSECSSEEAPASVQTGATQAGAVKEEESSCCSSKLAEPSN